MDPPNRPLTLLSRKPVFRFFSISKRKSIVKWCPELRKAHQILPFHLNSVESFVNAILIDKEIKWGFARIYGNGNEGYKLTKCTFPCGKYMEIVDSGVEARLLEYYLNRSGTVIGFLRINGAYNIPPEPLPSFRNVKIRNLNLDFDGSYDYERWAQKLLKSLEKNQFDELKCSFRDDSDTTVYEDIKNFKIKHLIINTYEMDDTSSLMNLCFEKMNVTENDSIGDGQLFLERCRTILKRSDATNWKYTYMFRRPDSFDILEFSRTLQNEWGLKHEYIESSGVLSKNWDEENKLNVICIVWQPSCPWIAFRIYFTSIRTPRPRFYDKFFAFPPHLQCLLVLKTQSILQNIRIGPRQRLAFASLSFLIRYLLHYSLFLITLIILSLISLFLPWHPALIPVILLISCFFSSLCFRKFPKYFEIKNSFVYDLRTNQ